MKRFFAILLSAMVLPAMLLTGCSEKGEAAVEEITATEAVTEEAIRKYPLNSTADICLSEFSFGMSKQELEAAIDDTPLDIEFKNHSIYKNISLDLDESLNSAAFRFGKSGLFEIQLDSGTMSEQDAFELRDKFIEQFSEMYGFSAFSSEDWDIYSDGYCSLSRKTKNDASVFIRINDNEDAFSVTVMFTSNEHLSFENVELKSVLQ
ncbi:MAG: hypothetical protein J6K17_11180 [Oscillospiraceae bacterium]|nr:hypothetical protein [Oscillospiraceae bacterium]